MGKPLSLSLLGLLALTIAVLAIGCGTVCNLAGGFVHPEEEPKVYGGVQRDLGFIGEMASDPKGFNCPAGGQGAAMTAIFILGMAAVDPVLSLVGDTLTLPITLLVEHQREARKTSEQKAKMADADELPVTLGKPEATEPVAAEARESEGR